MAKLRVDPNVRDMVLCVKLPEHLGGRYTVMAKQSENNTSRWQLVPHPANAQPGHVWRAIDQNLQTKAPMRSEVEAWAGMIAYAILRPDGLPKDDCQGELELVVNYISPACAEIHRGVAAIKRAWMDMLQFATVSHNDQRTEEDTGMEKTITAAGADSMVVLAGYEARLDTYRQQVVGGYIGIGQVLIEAKESGAVPHGQWTEWVQVHAGLSERNAQRCMQAAREIGEGSALRKLDMSKAMALLSSGLDEEAREEIAVKAAEDVMSTRAVQDAIKDAQRKSYEEGASVARNNLLPELDKQRSMVSQLKSDAAQGKTAMQQLAQQANRAVESQRQALEEAAQARAIAEEAQRNAMELAARLKEARADAAAVKDSAGTEGADAEVKRLEGLLERKDAERRAAQQELLQLKAKLAQGSAVGEGDNGTLTSDAVALAVRTFLGTAGALPHMGSQLCQMELGRRQAFQTYVSMVADWVRGATAALDMVQGGGSCE